MRVGKTGGEKNIMKSKGTKHFRKEGDVSCGRNVTEDKDEKCPLDLATSRLLETSVRSETSLQRAEEWVGNEGKRIEYRQLEQGPATQGVHVQCKL